MANGSNWQNVHTGGGRHALAWLALVLPMALGLGLFLAGAARGVGSDVSSDEKVPFAKAETRVRSGAIPFKDVKFLIEHNATAEDTGFQVFLDGEPWNRLSIEDAAQRPVLEIRGRGHLKHLGLTELFFETNEPPNADVPIEELLARFPEGEYEFEGRSIEGARLAGSATLTHAIPKGPEILSPRMKSSIPTTP